MRSRLGEKLAMASHALGMPLLTAVAWRLSIKKMRHLSRKGRNKKKLIVLAKSAGIDDLEAAFNKTPASFGIYVLPRRLVKTTCHYFLQSRVTDGNYMTGDGETEKSKADYRAYLYKVLGYLKSMFGCDAILNFNVVYHAERELAAASSEIGIPFLCSYKECLRSPAFWKETERWYRTNIGRYHGWKIAVYNDQAREAMIRSGIVESWQVETTGCARLDYSHRLRRDDSDMIPRPTVLFFMIQETAGLPYFGGSFWKEGTLIQEGVGRALTWQSLAARANSVILNFADKNPGVDFILKGKTGYSLAQREQLREALPENVTIVSGGTGDQLLKRASVVVGFNSTAVLEAIAAGKPTIVPLLLSDEERHLEPYIHDLENAAVIAKSPQEFERALKAAVQTGRTTRDLSMEGKQVLRKYLGNDDGEAGKRLRRFIEEAVHRDLPSAQQGCLPGESPPIDQVGP